MGRTRARPYWLSALALATLGTCGGGAGNGGASDAAGGRTDAHEAASREAATNEAAASDPHREPAGGPGDGPETGPVDAGEAAPADDAREVRPGGDAAEGGRGDGEGEAGPTPADCASAQLPRERLHMWLSAAAGVKEEGGLVREWADQAMAGRVARPDPQSPRIVADAIAGQPAIRFDGDSDRMTMRVPVHGRTELSVILVSAADFQAPGAEWCCRPDETGCSGTYWGTLIWSATSDWSGVFLSSKQKEVTAQFRNGVGLYSDGAFYDSKVFGSGGYGTCRANPERDPNVAWLRPASIGRAFSLTVAVKHPLDIQLYVDGAAVWSRTMPGGKAAIVQDGYDDALWVGGGVFGKFFKGDIAEAIVYEKALSEAERAALELYLNCRYFPDRVKRR